MGLDLLPALNGIFAPFTSIFNTVSQREENELARVESHRQESFQERMSNTAHQREVADLQAAGLNPVLSAGGGGSSTPSGSSVAGQAPQIDMPGMMSMFFTMEQLAQGQQRIDIDRNATSADIISKLSGTDEKNMRTKLMEIGIPKEKLKAKGSELMLEGIKALNDMTRKGQNLMQHKVDSYFDNTSGLGSYSKKSFKGPPVRRQR